jgi:plastocyanin
MNKLTIHTIIAVTMLVAASMPNAFAAKLMANVVDKAGAPVANAVVTVQPVTGKAPSVTATQSSVTQMDLQFSPYVTVVPVGSKVMFPNNDQIDHHVKSFSPVKLFEFVVGKSGSPEPVLFDKVGAVPVHCLLHDWMRAYVYVVDTPWYAKTNERGNVTIDVPTGNYEVTVWHPDLGAVRPVLKEKTTLEATDKAMKFTFDFVPRKQRQPKKIDTATGVYGG